jgi:hypothetical protein
MNRYHVPAQTFIEVWNKSETPEEAARIMRIPKPSVVARAASYRNKGLNVKRMKRRNKNAINVEELNRYIRELDNPPDVPEENHKCIVKQADVYWFLREFVEHNGFQPSQQEMAAHFHVDTIFIANQIQELEQNEWISLPEPGGECCISFCNVKFRAYYDGPRDKGESPGPKPTESEPW